MGPVASSGARWEWRTFGERFPEMDVPLLSGPHDVRSSVETYIVSADPAVNVKIRADQLEVKTLQRVDGELEQWFPVLKAPFPLQAADIARLFPYWHLSPPPLTRPTYTPSEFLAEVVAPVMALRTVPVTKERHGGHLHGCIAELARLSVDGRSVETVAVESEDCDKVRHAVRALGLSAHPNVSYVSALRRLADAHRG
ncbi:MAG: hypothetical protein AB7O67_22645 [Vicinamibacterales bacterium]